MKFSKLLPIVCMSIAFLLSDCQRNIQVEPDTPEVGTDEFKVTANEAVVVAGEHFHLKALQENKSARQSATNDDPFKSEERVVKNAKTLKDGSEDLIHIVNYKDNKGFVLVSADKRFTPIIAFSNNGEFNEEGLPGVKDWLEISKKYIKDAKKELKEQRAQEKSLWEKYLKSKQTDKGAKKKYDECPNCDYYFTRSTGRMTDNIAQYSQGSSFSYYTPGDGGCDCGRKPAGCGAVAMAIVMRYHRHPDMMMSFNGESMLLDDAGYDAMPRLRYEAGYDCGRPNDNIRRLSMLLRLNGAAASSGYGVFGNCNTWTIPGDINNALSMMGYSNGGYWSDLTNQHYDVVFSELTQNKPVIFTGTTCDTCLGNAHIWVADGLTEIFYTYQTSSYDENGSFVCYCANGAEKYISMNWGHGGQNNGEYLAFYNFSYYKNYNGYNKYIRALVNIRP